MKKTISVDIYTYQAMSSTCTQDQLCTAAPISTFV